MQNSNTATPTLTSPPASAIPTSSGSSSTSRARCPTRTSSVRRKSLRVGVRSETFSSSFLLNSVFCHDKRRCCGSLPEQSRKRVIRRARNVADFHSPWFAGNCVCNGNVAAGAPTLRSGQPHREGRPLRKVAAPIYERLLHRSRGLCKFLSLAGFLSLVGVAEFCLFATGWLLAIPTRTCPKPTAHRHA